MKKIMMVLSLVVFSTACKSTQNAATNTTVEQEKKTEKVARPVDLDLSKKVKLEPKNTSEKANPRQVQVLDKTKIQKMSIEKRDNSGKN